MAAAPSATQSRIVRLARQVLALAGREGWPRGRHLTELELVDALGVSRTAVRTGLRLLEQRGAVKATPRRGYFLQQDGGTLANLHLEAAPTAEEELHARLLRDRIRERLPVEVTAAQLARRYEVSRALVARVLATMADAGLLSRGGGHAWRFAPSLDSVDGVRLSYEFRLLLEPAALLLPSFAASAGALAELRRRHLDILAKLPAVALGPRRRRDRLEFKMIFELDAEFHERLAKFSGNPFVELAVRRHNALRRLFEFGSYGNLPRVREWCGEHIAVLDALLEDRRQDACLALRHHLDRALHHAASRDALQRAERGG